ncbi:MAG: class I SAM-dependent methyltransferase [Corynebacterium sp.]|nr:class I SAM-dependent methyltransferase [Corynebacterium sp.]
MANHAHNQRAHFHGRAGRPIGVITRGTTNQNRLRRCDRWLRHNPEFAHLLHHISQPLAIDVGYGASHTTTVEWARWLREVRSDIAVRGLEIDPTRVLDPIDGVEFGLGGFELAGLRPQVVRAFNVLRQYDVSQVYAAWDTVLSNMDPRGWFIEGTCDELGRQMSWILLDANGPRSLQLCWDPFHTPYPSFVAQRLPKALIHRNVPGEGIYELLGEADAAWERCAGFAPYGPRVRWREALRLLAAAGVPVETRRSRCDNLLSVPWEIVA